ncbi:SHOCT domain-containing protein [Actinocrispum sp. NPDC049592]|uniref:SHOCT domain-containing protein n=1 Tax=Actinocrispum sp. NPDC049592 TaxID=3154835 RepID=UPI0034415CE4
MASHDIPPYPALGLPELGNLLSYSDPNGKYYVFCRDRPAKKGGPGLVVARNSSLGFEKIVSDYFPLTEAGWLGVWRTLAALDPREFDRCRKNVARNAARYQLRSDDQKLRLELEQNTRLLLSESIFLGGYTPAADLTLKSAYDLRFMTDSLTVFAVGTTHTLGRLNYDTFTNIQITGPGVTQSTNPFADSAGKIIGTAIRATQTGISDNILNAAESVISAGLKAAGTRSVVKTVLSMRTTDSELFFLHTKTEPGQLRIDLSPVLGRIREVLASTAANSPSPQGPDATSIIAQLKDASMLLEQGLLTRDEFDRLKSRLLSGG